MIKVENLVKTFELNKQQRKELNTSERTVTAVSNVSFTCEPGKIHALLGANGAGKTTTMRMMSTIFKPTSGSIEIAGIDALKDPEEARKHIGFLTGSAGLYARLTPNEIVDYYGSLYGISKADIQIRKKKLFEMLNMHDFQNKRIGKLSTGMKQKVSICRTMIHDPQVILFDEPTSGLDVITAAAIIELIKQCKDEGKTVIFSSHIMGEVDLLSDNITIIHKGKTVVNSTMEEFRAGMQAPNLTAEFIRVVNQQETAAL